VQLNLPRPTLINFTKKEGLEKLGHSERLIQQEIERMLIHDNSKFPQEHTKPVNKVLGPYSEYSLRDIEYANGLIQQEMEAQEDYQDKEEIIASYSKYIDEFCKMSYVPSSKTFNEFVSLSAAEQKEVRETEHKFVKKHLDKEQKRITTIEQEMKEKYEQCMANESQKREKIDELVKDLDKKSRQLDVFVTIQNLEKRILQSRVEEQSNFLKQQERKERELQQEYYRLTHK
jgi:hypothetical protein